MKYWSLIFLGLIGFNLIVWQGVFDLENKDNLEIHFLDVGQGDSQLVILPGGVKLLIDGGANKEVLFELANILPSTDRYIDLVFMTHPQLDHYGGLKEVTDRYQIGAFVYSGRSGEGDSWIEFENHLIENDISIIKVQAGNLLSYQDSKIKVISPDELLVRSQDANESSIVLKIISEGVSALLTGDIGQETEKILIEKYDLDSDVLKIAHHGSRYSSSQVFLDEVTPAISVIQVGENRFGHPTQTVIHKLWGLGSSVYRNDEDGTVSIIAKDGVLGVKTE